MELQGQSSKYALNLLGYNVSEDDILDLVKLSGSRDYAEKVKADRPDLKFNITGEDLNKSYIQVFKVEEAVRKLSDNHVQVSSLPQPYWDLLCKKEVSDGPIDILPCPEDIGVVINELELDIVYQTYKEAILENGVGVMSGKRNEVNRIEDYASHSYVVVGIGILDNLERVVRVLDSNYHRRGFEPQYLVPLKLLSGSEIFMVADGC